MEQSTFEFMQDEYDDLDFCTMLHNAVMLEHEAKQAGCETLAQVWQYENQIIHIN